MSGFGPLIIFIESLELGEEEKKMLTDPRVGGVILFDRNYQDKEQLKRLTSEIKSVSEDLIIATDYEGGRVQRFKGGEFADLPPASLFGRCYDEAPEKSLALIRAAGALAAYELTQVHIDLSLAPVLDINAGISGVIGDRALHSDPQIISSLGAEYIRGLHNQNMLGVGKHYPGHGSIKGDTHGEEVIDNRPMEEIRNSDMRPYKDLIQDDLLDAVMMAHVIYPKVDSKPASLSKVWMTETLGEMNFEGLVLSDDMNMKGIGNESFTATEVLEAGCLMMLICDNKELLRKTMNELEDDAVIEGCRNRFKQCWRRRKEKISGTEKKVYDFEEIRVELSDLIKHYA